MKLTVKNIGAQQLQPGKREQIIFDDEIPGFGLRLREGGFRGLIFQYKSGSTHRRIAMGSVGAIDLAKAREDAKDYYARVRLGQDPAADMRDAKVKREHTFDAAAIRQTSNVRAGALPDQAGIWSACEGGKTRRIWHRNVIGKVVERDCVATCT